MRWRPAMRRWSIWPMPSWSTSEYIFDLKKRKKEPYCIRFPLLRSAPPLMLLYGCCVATLSFGNEAVASQRRNIRKCCWLDAMRDDGCDANPLDTSWMWRLRYYRPKKTIHERWTCPFFHNNNSAITYIARRLNCAATQIHSRVITAQVNRSSRFIRPLFFTRQFLCGCVKSPPIFSPPFSFFVSHRNKDGYYTKKKEEIW